MAEPNAEQQRLDADTRRERNWKRWGPYLAERQWGTVREDYSASGDCWNYLPHDHARSRAYRWGEDGLLGFTDRECRLCFAVALWNGRDPILKERLFGLTNTEGNHGEDVKECYYYLDSTPTHSYCRALYKYPQAAFPYAQLQAENARRGRDQHEYELADTGVFAEERYFDVTAEYAKADTDDVLIRLTVANRGPDAAALHLLPTLWYRNTWAWGCTHEGCWLKPRLKLTPDGQIQGDHVNFGRHRFAAGPGPDGQAPQWLFTENETNTERLFGTPSYTPYVKDAFHARVVEGREDAVNPQPVGTKVAAWYQLQIPAGESVTVRLRLAAVPGGVAAAAASVAAAYPKGRGGRSRPPRVPSLALGREFDAIFAQRRCEADDFYAAAIPAMLAPAAQAVSRQAYAGLLWSKQFYHYIVRDWLAGDPYQPPPPAARLHGRNADWGNVYNRDVLSMPDKWEYPWFAAWDLAFHVVALARVDAAFAKEQLVLFLREWYMHPNGQLPAYEFALDDVNPPVHAWAVLRVYHMTGGTDRVFLSRCFQKLIINFTWWVNRKDLEGKNLFAGGFLGLDNIGLFDRSKPLPGGGHLQQADGTAWMAFYCLTMLNMALELARDNAATEDMASKFFEHFVAIVDAINAQGGSGLWHEDDGFYYDQLRLDGHTTPMQVRSLVGLIPLLAVGMLDDNLIQRLPGFKKRLDWFLANRQDLSQYISYACQLGIKGQHCHRLLAIPTRVRLERVLRRLLDEREFLSPYGIRSLSRHYHEFPYIYHLDGQEYRLDYTPGESKTGIFGGNSNWRGPVWFPINYLLIEALDTYHQFYGDTLTVEYPTGSGHQLNLHQVADELAARLARLFLPDEHGQRPCHAGETAYASNPHWRDLLLFHEYFHGDTGRGLGASHQTGWTALVATCLERLAPPARPD